jgi:alpha-glucosidase
MMIANLAPRLDGSRLAVQANTPLTTPWRVLLIAPTPERLIESNLISNLNPPSAIADMSWIQPGKAAWNWWSGSHAESVSFEPGMNTATIEHYVDFAAESRLEYMLIDEGWAAAAPDSRSPADITKANPAVDLPEILRHAKSKSVGVWLWAHWSSVDSQMDQAFPLFETWGVAGVKIDFMNRDDQWMVEWYRRVAKKAADHHLMLDFHGAFKPDGISRTFPNVLTREGVLGLEYSKWSARANPQHNVMLAFTRLLAGPMDYTPGGFNNASRAEFRPRNVQPMVLGTRAHQLALYVVFESPLAMVSDYPGAYRGQREFEFIKAVPASWDETRAVNGKIGEYVTVARKRGEEWYLGSINDWTTRDLDVPLGFLGSGEYLAEVYADAPDASDHPKHTVIEQKRVSAATRLKLSLASGGGAAIRFRPVR